MQNASKLSLEEASDLRYLLDDADKLGELGGVGSARMEHLWRRLHLWIMASQGDEDARMLLAREFGCAPL